MRHCRSLGVELWSDDGILRYRAPKEVITGELKRSLSEHKLALIEILDKGDSPTEPGSSPDNPMIDIPASRVRVSGPVPAWVDDPALSVSLADVRASVELARSMPPSRRLP